MKKLLTVIVAAGLGAAIASLLVAKSLATRHAAQLAGQILKLRGDCDDQRPFRAAQWKHALGGFANQRLGAENL